MKEKADREYWNSQWKERALPRPVQIERGIFKIPTNRYVHEYFKRLLGLRCKGKKILEIGCGRSIWLPYFAKTWEMNVTGLDFSSAGCELAARIVAREGVEGSIVLADFLNPPPQLLGAFDYVFSFGVVEHFEPPSHALKAMKRFLRSGGRIITIVPNLTGAAGWVQQRLDRHIYDKHVPLDLVGLKREHEKAGFTVSHEEYLDAFNFNVLNVSSMPPGYASAMKKSLYWSLIALTGAVWLFQNIFRELPARRLFSGYVACAGDDLQLG